MGIVVVAWQMSQASPFFASRLLAFWGPLTVDHFDSKAEAQACVRKASYAVR